MYCYCCSVLIDSVKEQFYMPILFYCDFVGGVQNRWH